MRTALLFRLGGLVFALGGLMGFSGCETGTPVQKGRTLLASVAAIDRVSGAVTIGGSDVRYAAPFRFEWGDGKTSEGFFPASHVYTDPRRNYVVKVSVTYGGGDGDSVAVPVLFRETRPEPPAAPVRPRY